MNVTQPKDMAKRRGGDPHWLVQGVSTLDRHGEPGLDRATVEV